MNDTTQPPKLPTIAVGGSIQAIVPQSFDEAWRIANAVCRAGLAPDGLETPEKAMIAIMHGLEVGLPPMAALQSIAVINNRPTIYGDGLVGLVRASGLLEVIKEHMEGDGDNLTAVCTIKRRGEPELIVGRFSVADAKTARLWGKLTRKGDPTPWVTHPWRMLKVRARAFALRDGFADVLKGLAVREEMEDVELMRDVTPAREAALEAPPPPPPPDVPPAAAAAEPVDARDAQVAWEEPPAPENAPAAPTQATAAPAAAPPPPAPPEPPPADEPFDPETGELTGPAPVREAQPGPAVNEPPVEQPEALEPDELIPPLPPVLDRRQHQLSGPDVRDWLEELENAFGSAESLEELQEQQRARMAPAKSRVPASAWKTAQAKLDANLMRLRP
jgi:hypothetical protein